MPIYRFPSLLLRVRSLVVASLCLAVVVPQSWAWGRAGHRLTALVAEQYLTPEARAQATALLNGGSLASVASWADDYRSDHPETGPWHYVDIPGSAAGQAELKFDRNRDCPVSAADPKSPWRDCVTDRILYFEGRLGDDSLSTADRAQALKFLVHLIGDVHQPFHAIGDDRGGNGIKVSFLGSPVCGTSQCNLHAVWDDAILEEQGLSDKKYVERLVAEIETNHWERLAGGEPTGWANVSHHYADNALAPQGALITRAYVSEESKIVDAQLALGGLRLAHVLNRILVAPEATPGQTPLAKP
jgi:hypothetical protein